MFEISERVMIRRPIDELFGLAADPHLQQQWDSAGLQRIEKLTEGPLGVGSRYRGSFKRMGTVEYEFTEFEPNQRFSHDAELPIGHLHHSFEFSSVADGTQPTQRIAVEPRGLGKVVAPLMKPMLRRRMRVIDEELKRHAKASR
jgi:hypothetical protein